jgi:hypothetical protein
VRLILLFLLTSTLVSSGCARSGDMKSWQQDVERYVEKNDGDPTVLRDVILTGSRRGFGYIGKDDPRESQDANGVLLGHQVVRNRPWFVYLVGIVDEQEVEQIRLAALSYVHGKADWRIGPKDAEARKRYQNYNLSLWKQQTGGGRGQPPPEYTTFPRDADMFDMSVTGARIDAVHQGSGAQWEVDLAEK